MPTTKTADARPIQAQVDELRGHLDSLAQLTNTLFIDLNANSLMSRALLCAIARTHVDRAELLVAFQSEADAIHAQVPSDMRAENMRTAMDTAYNMYVEALRGQRGA